MWGDCSLQGKGDRRYYLIRITRDADDLWQRETLIHEWAHAISWSHRDDQRDSEHGWHGPEFGVAYAAAYTTVFNDDTCERQGGANAVT